MSIQTNRVIEKANRHVHKRQFDRALQEYERALASDPEDLRILHKKGDLLVRMEVMALAAQTYLKLAGLYSQLGFQVKAIAVYKQALKTEAAPIEVHLQLSATYHQLRMKREAAESLEIVLDEYERAGRLADMPDVLLRLAEIESDSIEPLMRLCDLFLHQAERGRAVELLYETAQKLEAQERTHEHRQVMQRLIALDASFDTGEQASAQKFLTFLDDVSGVVEEVEISDADIFPVEIGEEPAPRQAMGENRFFMDLEATPSVGIEPVGGEADTNILDLGEGPSAIEQEATVLVSPRFLESRQKSRPIPQRDPIPEPVGPDDDELEECLQEIDFFVQQRLFDDAWDLLTELQAKKPRHPRILARIQAVAELRRGASGRHTLLSRAELRDGLLSVA